MQLVQELSAFIYTWGTLSDSLRALAHAVGFGRASRGTPISSQHSTVDGTARRPRRFSYESQREGAEYGPRTRKHVKGIAEKVKGAIKETAGKLAGDKKLKTEGKFDKTKGSAHNLAGDVKDTAREASKSADK